MAVKIKPWTIPFLFALIILSAIKIEAQPVRGFNLSDVKILDGPFLIAQQADLNYILALDPDRLLAPYLKDAGITPLKDNYSNWESSGLNGHTGGHYLSALSLMYAATGMEELSTRLNYMIKWLDSCQQKNGNGYVGGIPDGQAFWKEIAAGNTKAVQSRWVPLYNIHKLYAGLYDAYRLAGNEKAFGILVNLSDWFYNLAQKLTDDQIQEILKTEHGGLNEVFAQVAKITGNKKYLELAIRMSERSILNPLIRQKNELTGKHANTQIPKIIGFKYIADATGKPDWDSASVFFWNTVINRWTVSIGGNSIREHFHSPDDFSAMVSHNQGPETCNTYNMLKLTQLLYFSDPQTKYMDYYEKALFNHILSSVHPVKSGFVYFTPMRPRHYRVYSQAQESFWCCVGTGMENHAKYGEMIYAHDDNNLFVNLFIASALNWKEKELNLTQYTKFPYENFSVLKIQTHEPIKMSLKIRKPVWAIEREIKVYVNNKITSNYTVQDNFITLARTWTNGDEVKIEMPMHVNLEYLPDGSSWASVKYGP
ncbi:MAG TPA: glycoside hydrolase family 127 protein, partial [Chitinophagaceae bacterium]|nr:glycoside hydrolase family 127 protein [Chitinophagaceae bacterium]